MRFVLMAFFSVRVIWLLAGDIREILRPPFPRDNQVRHKSSEARIEVADSDLPRSASAIYT